MPFNKSEKGLADFNSQISRCQNHQVIFEKHPRNNLMETVETNLLRRERVDDLSSPITQTYFVEFHVKRGKVTHFAVKLVEFLINNHR